MTTNATTGTTANDQSVSRRNFVGMGAMAAAMGAGMGMAGLAAKPEQAKAHDNSWDADRGLGSADLHPVEGPVDPMTLPANDGHTLNNLTDVSDLAANWYAPGDPWDEATKGYTNAQLDVLLLNQTMVEDDYTTPGGKTIPAVYINLRNRLNRIGTGMGSDIDDNENAWDFLMLLFSEDDAQHLLEMPMYKTFNALDYHNASGRDLEECKQILASMGDRGLISTRIRAGVPFYELMTMEPGIWERNIYRIDDPEYVNAHHHACGTDMNIAFNETPCPQLMVLPCSEDVVEGDMVPYTSWEDAIRMQEEICVIPCACRRAADTLGTRDPDCAERFGTETCIFMGDYGHYMIEHGYGRQLTAEECIAEVKANVEKGLVPEILWTKTQDIMCQCCLCDCGVMGAYHAYGCEGEVMDYVSPYNLKYDAETCIGCGTCVDRCPMGAITLGDDGVCAMDRQCIRCGQCAYICPVDARKLVAKPLDEIRMPDDDWRTKELTKGRRRILQGLIHDFVPAEHQA